MNGIFTYESWASSGQSMRLCSIRKTRYCSLEKKHQRLLSRPRDGGREVCSVQDVEDGSVFSHIQPDRHGRNPRVWLEQNLPKGCTYERAIRKLAYDKLQQGA